MDQEDNLMDVSSYGEDVDQYSGALIVSQGGVSSYGEDVDQYSGALIVSQGGIDILDLDPPMAVDSSSDEKFPSVDQLHSMSQGGRNTQSASGRVISASQIAPTSSASFSWCIKTF